MYPKITKTENQNRQAKQKATVTCSKACSEIGEVRIETFKDYVGELNVVYRRTKMLTTQIKSSHEAYEWLYPHFDLIMDDHEQVKVIYLNQANYIVNLYHASVGSDIGAIIPFKSIFRNALLTQTSSIILAHNHPSGAPRSACV